MALILFMPGVGNRLGGLGVAHVEFKCCFINHHSCLYFEFHDSDFAAFMTPLG